MRRMSRSRIDTPQAVSALHAGDDQSVCVAPQFVVTGAAPTTALRGVPFVPTALLKAHDAFVACDDRFTAACRLLAVLARRGLPAGTYTPLPYRGRTAARRAAAGAELAPLKPVRLGSRLSPAAARAGANFLSPEIAAHVQEVLLFRQRGALIDEVRIYQNMLSSAAALFNLLGPLALDLDLATRVFRRLLPDHVHAVTGIAYEISPARDEQGRRGITPAYLGDATAWDALITVLDREGRDAWIAVETKYVGMAGPVAPPKPRYAEAARASGLYRDPSSAVLGRPGIEQLMREHLLLDLAVRHGLAGRGLFLLVGPAQNHRVQMAGKLYADQLAPHDPEAQPERVGFGVLTVEAVLAAIAAAGAGAHAQAYFTRYLDLESVASFVLDRRVPVRPRLTSPLKPGLPPTGGRNPTAGLASGPPAAQSGAPPAVAPGAPASARSRKSHAVEMRATAKMVGDVAQPSV